MTGIRVFTEPTLSFGFGQAMEDPRDGLTLFGPLDEGQVSGMRVGVIGTRQGIEYYRDWARRIQGPLFDATSPDARPPFPGVEAAFRISWRSEPVLEIEIGQEEIKRAVHLNDRHQRIHATVGIYSERLLQAARGEDRSVDLWFVIVPDIVHTNCRPQSTVPLAEQVKVATPLRPRVARRLRIEPSLFETENQAALAYQYDVDFHNQLKARLLSQRVLTQLVLETTIMPVVIPDDKDRGKNDSRPFQAAIAWNLVSTAFYKAGGRPWKLENIRPGVCYVGLVFKKDASKGDSRNACCAAQMFLDSGDGVVFRGAIGPWYSPKDGEFHLDAASAKALAELTLQAYAERCNGATPRELFIHGRVSFSDEEWHGFQSAIDPSRTNLVGIKIRDDVALRLYRFGKRPVLRGTAYIQQPRRAFLWTKGFAPRLKTFVGREVPSPLSVSIDRGDASIETVLKDVLALTKLNYNACMLGDGIPVTLRFADAVGEILTAGPLGDQNPLPFKHYI
jgi:hypothetical protein